MVTKALIDENFFIEVLLANATITRRMTEEEMDIYRAPFLEPESRYPSICGRTNCPLVERRRAMPESWNGSAQTIAWGRITVRML